MKGLLLVIGVCFIVGCAPVAVRAPYVGKPMMPYEDYEILSTATILAKTCFNMKQIDGQLVTDVNDAIRWQMSLFTTDPVVLNNLISKHWAESQKVITKRVCSEGELGLRSFVSRIRDIQVQQQLIQQQRFQQQQTNQILQAIQDYY